MRASRPLQPLGFETIASGRLQTPLKTAIIKITADEECRWRDDSGDPMSEGHILKIKQTVWYNGDPTKLRFSGAVTVTFYKVA